MKITPQNIIMTIIGAIIGIFCLEGPGAVGGGCIGFLLGYLIETNKRLEKLEKIISDSQEDFSLTLPELEIPDTLATETPSAAPGTKATSPTLHSPVTDTPPAPKRSPETVAASPLPHQPSAFFEQKIIQALKAFFTQGNIVVRIGIIVLFFGVAFLLKYASEKNMLPIELRLAAVAAGAIAMEIVGWLLRNKRTTYSVIIQGGAVGVLYLTVFTAARIYHLLPLGLTFFIMVALVAFSGILAVLQNARPLAIFGAIGGFLAPVLISTGQGSHVVLFSYYTLLNAGIFGIAWFKAWRLLNWIGFVATFIISTAWGVQYYQPADFATTEPFLLLFFFFYATISILFARRQPPELKGYIDGTLVFALPLCFFGLQSGLVHDYQYGLAISSLGIGLYYIFLATILWKRMTEGLRLLSEAFLALGVVFGSLTIPLALSSSWTSGLWGLEGAGLVWIGLRQHRVLARSFGLLLQLGAGIAFIQTVTTATDGMAVLNGVYMSCLVLSLTGLISAFCFTRYRQELLSGEKSFPVILMIWGLVWWFGGGWHEITAHINTRYQFNSTLLFTAGSCGAIGWISQRLRWNDMIYPPLLLIPVTTILTVMVFLLDKSFHPGCCWGLGVWGLVFFTQYALFWHFEQKWDSTLTRVLHQITLFLLIFLLSWEASWIMKQILREKSWRFIAWGGVPGLSGLLLLQYGKKVGWPIQRFEKDYCRQGLLPIMVYLWLWIIFGCLQTGNPWPLAYLPILNPLEITQIFTLLIIIKWWLRTRGETIYLLSNMPPRTMEYSIGSAAFLGANAVVARTVHFWGAVPYKLQPLYDSGNFQTAISILWPLLALGLMLWATRKVWRQMWFIGAALLGAAVVKLFLVDLDDIGTVARIISFLVVGFLMLIIGYFSPLPPRNQAAETAQ